MSRAPIISGTRKLAKPAQMGTSTRKIMVVPCRLNISLYSVGLSTCMLAAINWLRMSSASTPPTTKKKMLRHKYMIPMRLWSTVVIQSKASVKNELRAAGMACACVVIGVLYTSRLFQRFQVSDQLGHLRISQLIFERRHQV